MKTQEPILWNKSEQMGRINFEYRYIHGFHQEFGEITLFSDGGIHWRYGYNHSLKLKKSRYLYGNKVCLSHDELPFWFKILLKEYKQMGYHKLAM